MGWVEGWRKKAWVVVLGVRVVLRGVWLVVC